MYICMYQCTLAAGIYTSAAQQCFVTEITTGKLNYPRIFTVIYHSGRRGEEVG